ncbi:cap-specific mRNA (nucleoside-2'-O-)-methyltransferase 1-like [Nylanderia fulva]|uniref:cap-specific mRNA (nucleoside-2'-O-)-methyltransferase 1-like n=1 Tax=Nylanderia fulva TaxID=613905 RepID=UPI0010FAD489|nr:cap-specific mRNA (nucleoside-2'-O-)-methyltransferase 1-like [Nylanderia fulva]
MLTELISKMDSSSDDSILSNEDMKLKTSNSFDNYSQDHRRNSHYSEMPHYTVLNAFDNDDNYLSHKKRSGHSSSSSDDQQYSESPKYGFKMNINNHDESLCKRKKRKLHNKDMINDLEQEKHTQFLESSKMCAYNSINHVSHTSKAQNMMEKMGYKPGKGLGKDDQGRVEPIEAITQRGRRGFGHFVPGLKEASLKWNPEEEEIKAIEDMEWLPNVHSHTLLGETVINWVIMGSRKLTIDDETTYCNPEILEQVIRSKTVFDKLDKVELRKARTRSNPYETIRTANFLNRAAVKMANIDRACNFMFTNPKGLHPNELLYFADVCAGPGGFSEYVLSRKKWHSKGFGFTLRNENDFTLDEFFAGPCETFHPFYGSKGNGDVFDPQNQEEFRSLVMKHTYGKGVHFMMSDGGFSVEGQENIQEILSKQLYLCQCLVALMIVRPGGHFVTKLFDLFTPFSVGLIYLMYRCFENICIFKPNTSRPANSERYLICKRKKLDTEAIMFYLSDVNRLLLSRDENSDVIHLVPPEILEADKAFVTYLRSSNDVLGKKQVIGLLKIAAFCEDPMLTEPKQADMRKECLNYWNIPDKTRVRPQIVRPQDKIREILNNTESCFFRSEAEKLKIDNAKSILSRPYNWYCMPCGFGPCVEEDKAATFYLGLGRRKVFRYTKGKWESIGDVQIELPPDTLVYAELVYETKWMGKYFSKTRALHILDAYMIGGEDISRQYLCDRYKSIKKVCDALWKPVPNEYVCVRPKPMFMLNPMDIEKNLRVTRCREVKIPVTFEWPKSYLERDNENDTNPVYYTFNSVLFLPSIAHPWSRHISQKTKHFYVTNEATHQSEYEIRNGQNNRPRTAEASFMEAFEKRIIWHWPGDGTLNMNALLTIINPLQNV